MKNKFNFKKFFKERRFLSPIILGAIFLLVILVDELTKGLIIKNYIPNVGDKTDFIPGFINFIHVQNRGAAWGIFGGRPVFLIVLTSIVLILFIAFYILRLKKVKNNISWLLTISSGLIIGGAIGNLFDRIIFGYVRDFINFQFFDFPVFNFADISLTFGIIIMLIYFCFFFSKEDNLSKKDEKTQKNSEKVLKNSENDLNEGEND